MAIRIITDSTVDAAPAYKEQFAAIVPLTVSFGEEDYEDGVTLDRNDFYKKLESCRELPKTSQASPDAFMQARYALSCYPHTSRLSPHNPAKNEACYEQCSNE